MRRYLPALVVLAAFSGGCSTGHPVARSSHTPLASASSAPVGASADGQISCVEHTKDNRGLEEETRIEAVVTATYETWTSTMTMSTGRVLRTEWLRTSSGHMFIRDPKTSQWRSAPRQSGLVGPIFRYAIGARYPSAIVPAILGLTAWNDAAHRTGTMTVSPKEVGLVGPGDFKLSSFETGAGRSVLSATNGTASVLCSTLSS